MGKYKKIKPTPWRSLLTDDERKIVARYDALMDRIRAIRLSNKELIQDFRRIQKRAIQAVWDARNQKDTQP